MTPTPAPTKRLPRFGLRLIFYTGLLALLVFGSFRFAHFMTYPIPSEPVPSPAPGPIQELVWSNQQGQRQVAWFLPCAKVDAPVILFFHGSGQNLNDLQTSGFLGQLTELGAHILALEYPGYGNNEGSPSEASLTEAAVQAMDWALGEYPQNAKVLMGWGLGAAVALQTAKTFEGQVQGLILLSAWTSWADVARAHFPSWLVSLFVRDSYASLQVAAFVGAPSLLIHGSDDDVIPLKQAELLAEALGTGHACEFIKLEQVGHNNVLAANVTWIQIGYFLRHVSGDL